MLTVALHGRVAVYNLVSWNVIYRLDRTKEEGNDYTQTTNNQATITIVNISNKNDDDNWASKCKQRIMASSVLGQRVRGHARNEDEMSRNDIDRQFPFYSK